ncbi:heavy metal-associated isoprenylated plant protein 32-like [Phalaenopsis equestris]|uniref:heavy metal-associated isoprenylated plant protein 32-like n=1 Tax=Phalaenopsis equestris TaxID=78828 RepID=UPI0009E614BF|nr:heavy metal-associated isoprenylated plant protein 32-like [Phalaenopsis equestris]
MNKLTKAEDLNLLKLKTCVLKVNIHCEGCAKKVKKILQKIDGVYSVAIDEEQGKVTVTGNVDSSILVKKLRKSGKHAELCSSKKNSNIDATKGQKNTSNKSGTKDQKLQLLQKELMNMKFPSTKDHKSVKFSAPAQDLDYGSEFDDSLDDGGYSDETDASDDEIDDYKKSAAKRMVTVKKGFGGEVHAKGNGISKNGGGGTHEAKNGGNKGNSNGGKSNGGLTGVPMAAGTVPAGYFNSGMASGAAAAPVGGGSVNPYQQQYMNDQMMQRQRMMMNGYPMTYGYPMPASSSYTSYFSDENTGGSCRIM